MKKIIHNVQILDASGSMQGAKYTNALEGINAEIEQMKNNKEVEYTETVIEFDSVAQNTERITEHYFMEPVGNCKPIQGRGAAGNTPLYQTAGYTLEKLLRKVRQGETVVVTIFTDGQHNCNWGKYANEKVLNELISDLQENHNFTITFMGTKEDTRHMVASLGLNFANTLTHENTPESIKCSYMSRAASLDWMAQEGEAKSSKFFNNSKK